MSNEKVIPATDDTKEEETTFDYSGSDNSDDYTVSAGPDTDAADDDDDAFCLEEKNDDDDVDAAVRFDFCQLKLANYKILNEADIKKRIEEDIAEVCFTLSVSKSEASILLCYYDWSVSKVNDAWFSDEAGVREKLGLVRNKKVVTDDDVCSDETKVITCGSCAKSFSADRISSASCGHPYCKECLSGYISRSIRSIKCNDSKQLKLRCPDRSCKAAIGEDMVESLVSVNNWKRYSDYLVSFYIKKNMKMKWCIGGDCKKAIEFLSGGNGSNFDVTCINCQTSFCWNCGEESHYPLDCKTVKMWYSKLSEYISCLPSHTKQCPNAECRGRTEQVGGCVHMRCKKCNHEFCGLCLGPSKNHQEYCNVNGSRMLQNQNKYKHYHQRWAAHQRSKVTVADYQKSMYDGCRVGLIEKAWEQVIEARRVLQWSYVFGYYLPENEPIKKQYFEYLQGVAETSLEKLHHHVRKEQFLPSSESNLSRVLTAELHELTTMVRNNSDKVVREMEEYGLPNLSFQNDVEDFWLCNYCSNENPWSSLGCKMCSFPACNGFITSMMKLTIYDDKKGNPSQMNEDYVQDDDDKKDNASQTDENYVQISIFDD